MACYGAARRGSSSGVDAVRLVRALEYTTCHPAALCSASPSQRAAHLLMERRTLQRFNKWRKVLGLSLVSLHFANMFDLSDSEIYRKISAVSNQKVKETSGGKNSNSNCADVT